MAAPSPRGGCLTAVHAETALTRAVALAWLTGHGLLPPLLAFILIAGIVYLSGSRLTAHADAIVDASALGGLWIGTMLLAAATALTELTTDVNAAALRAPSLGVGDLMGCSLATMLMRVVLDLIYLRRRILDDMSRNPLRVEALAIILTALAGAELASGGWGVGSAEVVPAIHAARSNARPAPAEKSRGIRIRSTDGYAAGRLYLL